MKTQTVVNMIANIVYTMQSDLVTHDTDPLIRGSQCPCYKIRLRRVAVRNGSLVTVGADEHMFTVKNTRNLTVPGTYCKSLRLMEAVQLPNPSPKHVSMMLTWRDKAESLFRQEVSIRTTVLSRLSFKMGDSWIGGDGSCLPGETIWYVSSVGDLMRVSA